MLRVKQDRKGWLSAVKPHLMGVKAAGLLEYFSEHIRIGDSGEHLCSGVGRHAHELICFAAYQGAEIQDFAVVNIKDSFGITRITHGQWPPVNEQQKIRGTSKACCGGSI